MAEGKNEIREFSHVLDFFGKIPQILSIPDKDERDEFMSEIVKSLNPSTLSVEVVGIASKASVMKLIYEHNYSDEQGFEPLYVAIDLILKLIDEGFKDSSLALSVIEDILDVITAKWIQNLIKCFENRKSLTSRIEPNKNKGLILLRILNEAQRRMSKHRHAYLSGWFLTLVSNLFPLSERSGVNLRGEFSVKNKRNFQNYSQELDFEPKDLNPNVQALYECAIQLEEFYSYPPSLIESSNLSKFKACLSTFLNALGEESAKVLELMVNVSPAEAEFMSIQPSEAEAKDQKGESKVRLKIENPSIISGLSAFEHFSLRTHTIRELFDIQIHHIPYVRQIVTQTFFILQYLSTTLNPAKENTKSSEAMDLEYDWIEQFSTQALKYLDFKRPCDRAYINALNLIKEHEKAWAEWKKNSCQRVDLPIEKVSEEGANKKVKLTVSDVVKYSDFIGTSELSQVWQLASRTDEILRDPERRQQRPDVADLLLPFSEHSLSKDYSASNSSSSQKYSADYSAIASAFPPSYLWRCCRVALRHNYNIFCSPRPMQPNDSADSPNLVRVLLGNVEPTSRFRGVSSDSAGKKSLSREPA